MSLNIILDRAPPDDEHDRQKWYKLRGKVEGSPDRTWLIDTIAVSALASGSVLLADRETKMRADVEEYYTNYMYLQGLE